MKRYAIHLLTVLSLTLLSISPIQAQTLAADNTADIEAYVQQQTQLTLTMPTVQSPASLCPQVPISLALIASGATTHYWQPANAINQHVKDGMQQWRQTSFDGRRFTFDNYIQFLPVATMAALKIAGVESRHNMLELSTCAAGGYLLMGIITVSTKEILDIQRPDGSAYNSFPSGHTATAFVGAELLRLEYGESLPWVAAAGYAVATLTGVMRIYNNRHWAGDVLAGAGVGILSANISVWLNDRLWHKSK